MQKCLKKFCKFFLFENIFLVWSKNFKTPAALEIEKVINPEPSRSYLS